MEDGCSTANLGISNAKQRTAGVRAVEVGPVSTYCMGLVATEQMICGDSGKDGSDIAAVGNC